MSNFISLEKAIAMTKLYRKEMNEILAQPYQGQNILSICETFEKEDILENAHKCPVMCPPSSPLNT